MCPADSGGHGSRAQSRRQAFAARLSRAAHAYHSSRRGRDRQFSCMRIALSSLAFEPATDRMHGELGSIARDPDADEAGVGGHIVYAIRHDLAEFLVLEVVHVHTPRIAFRTVIGSDILEVADQ